MLGSNIVIEGDPGKGSNVRVRGRSGLTISKQSGDDDEVLLGVQDIIFSDQPLIVGDC